MPAKTHGLSKTKPYKVWSTMLQRCGNDRSNSAHRYKARGIHVCAAWSSFDVFWADMGATYKPGLSIDRIDNDGPYAPENCRWTDRSTQMRNTRQSHKIETPHGVVTIIEAAERYGLEHSTLYARIKRNTPPNTWFLRPDKTRKTRGRTQNYGT